MLHLATLDFLAGRHIIDEQRNKEQKRAREKRWRNWRNLYLSEESLERSRGRRRRENFNENQRKAERNRARNKTLIYNGYFQLTYFFKLAKKNEESLKTFEILC